MTRGMLEIQKLPIKGARCANTIAPASASRVLPVTLDDDDGVIEIDDAVRVAGWQGDVVLGSVT